MLCGLSLHGQSCLAVLKENHVGLYTADEHVLAHIELLVSHQHRIAYLFLKDFRLLLVILAFPSDTHEALVSCFPCRLFDTFLILLVLCFSVLFVHFLKIVDLVEIDIFEDMIPPLFLFDVLDVKHHMDAFTLVQFLGFVDEAVWFCDG